MTYDQELLNELVSMRFVEAHRHPQLVPVIEIGLRGLDRLEAKALERRALRVADAGLAVASAS